MISNPKYGEQIYRQKKDIYTGETYRIPVEFRQSITRYGCVTATEAIVFCSETKAILHVQMKDLFRKEK